MGQCGAGLCRVELAGDVPPRLPLAQGACSKAKAAVPAPSGVWQHGVCWAALLVGRGQSAGQGHPKAGACGRGRRSPSPSQPMGEPWQGRNLPVCLVPPVFVSPVLGDVCRAGPVPLHGDGLRVHPAGHHLWGAGLQVTCPRRGPPSTAPLCSHQREKTACPTSCSGCQSRAPLVSQADLREETEEEAEA